LASKLKTFIEAYEHCFEVHERIEATRSSRNLSADQNIKLTKAMKDRDSTHKLFIDELAKL